MKRRKVLIATISGCLLTSRDGLAFFAQPPRDVSHSAEMQTLIANLLGYLRDILDAFQTAETKNQRVEFPSSEPLWKYQNQLNKIAAEPGSIRMSKNSAVLNYAEQVFSRYKLKLPERPGEVIHLFADQVGDLAQILKIAGAGGFGPDQAGNLAARQRLGTLFATINAVLQTGSVMGLLFQAD